MFQRETWSLDAIPGCKAFRDPRFCEDFSNDLPLRASEARKMKTPDWLAEYMLRERTWNTPIVLLDTRVPPSDPRLRRPWQLLEGHRRLSFLIYLRRVGRAQSEHSVWMVHY